MMEHRVFINYNGLSDDDQPLWIKWCQINVGLIEKDWWQQEITDNWDNNTSCWYFKNKTDADKFNFYVNLARTK